MSNSDEGMKFAVTVDGVTLRGRTYYPLGASSPCRAIVMAHGFSGAHYPKLIRRIVDGGFAVADFDFRCYGESDDDRGRVICNTEIDDLRQVITWFSNDTRVDSLKIGVVGSSLGGSIAIGAAARDPRIRAVVAGCPIASGERQLRKRYPGDEAWAEFYRGVNDALQGDLERTEKVKLLDRFDVVDIPVASRRNLPKNALMSFSRETVRSFMELRLEPDMKKISPRPVLILHGDNDPVVSSTESRALAAAGGDGSELRIVDSNTHFIFSDDQVIDGIVSWLRDRL